MVEEPIPDYIRPGLHFDPGPFLLDLYRLLVMYLADRRVMNLAAGHSGSSSIDALRNEHLYAETLRILISSAVTLRIAADQYPAIFRSLRRTDCGLLWPNWPKRKSEVLTIREACNKVVHAKRIHRDIGNPDPFGIHDNPEAYVLPHVYLYGKKDGQDWKAKLSIVDFVKRGEAVYSRIMRR